MFWKSNLLDVVFVTFTSGCYLVRHFWIVADDRKVADEFFAEVCEWSSEVRGEVLIFHDSEWMKNKELYDSIKSATFDNLILRAGLKEEIQTDFAQFFALRDVYERYRIPWKRGVLFIGPPGNGKTHTVKALVNNLARPCLYVKSFRSEYESDQENIRRVFARARATTPCFLVFEDVDSMIDDKSRSFFLNELDGFEANTGIVVVATTNYPEKLDLAILDRPSRFDRKYTFDLPGPGERAAYVTLWNDQLQPEMRLSAAAAENIAHGTEGFSFAYLKELFLSSMMQWMADSRTHSFEAVMLKQRTRLQSQMGATEQTASEQASAASA